ncbi:hypothetical protein [Kriegella aquimaris]|uniref:Uncharacterized protein n=1 Tax=Kriegella aquimaris TaxID=192904 RepID=A0A1G9MDN5_9FLAO|nr:hypothetical protein [Kriegella aquimaris]SDL72388.1 hypothetical protein SAMN04488514_102483 [Kriegella aquimaris]
MSDSYEKEGDRGIGAKSAFLENLWKVLLIMVFLIGPIPSPWPSLYMPF